MADDAVLADLAPDVRRLVDRIVAHVGAIDATSIVERLRSCDSRFERGELVCTERQKRAVPAPRTHFGIASHREIAQMDLWELEIAASEHDWDDGMGKPMQIVKSPPAKVRFEGETTDDARIRAAMARPLEGEA